MNTLNIEPYHIETGRRVVTRCGAERFSALRSNFFQLFGMLRLEFDQKASRIDVMHPLSFRNACKEEVLLDHYPTAKIVTPSAFAPPSCREQRVGLLFGTTSCRSDRGPLFSLFHVSVADFKSHITRYVALAGVATPEW